VAKTSHCAFSITALGIGSCCRYCGLEEQEPPGRARAAAASTGKAAKDFGGGRQKKEGGPKAAFHIQCRLSTRN
jgi:hypothetical protein